MTSALEMKPGTASEKPKSIFGQIINLLYSGGGENLQAIAVQDEKDPERIFLLGADLDPKDNSDTIKITNLNNFEAKFEKIFYGEYYINVKYADNEIKSIVAVACLPKNKERDDSGELYKSPCRLC
jgi:hypothetical protein